MSDFANDLTRPVEKQVTVTPSNSTDLTSGCRSLYFASDGDVAVTLIGDASDATAKVYGGVAGDILPFAARRVWATGTTATVIAWY